MKKAISREKFMEALQNHPEYIKAITTPDPEILSYAITGVPKTRDKIDKTLLTPTVFEALIDRYFNGNGWKNPYDEIALFSEEVRETLPAAKAIRIVDMHHNCALFFPQLPSKTFLKCVDNFGPDTPFKDIPKKFHTPAILAALFSEDVKIPEELITEDLVRSAIKRDPDCVSHIAVSRLTNTLLKYAFSLQSDLILQNLPEEVWDEELVEMTLKTGTDNNFQCIPEKFLTKEICMEAVKKNPELIENVPKQFRDDDLYMLAMCADHMYNEDLIPKKFFKPAMLLKLAAKDQENEKDPRGDTSGSFNIAHGIHNFKRHTKSKIPESTWLRVIKICPRAIEVIDKSDQTRAMIDTFFENASVELIDHLSWKINKTRVRKDHTPFMVGVEGSQLQNIIQRKMIAKRKKVEVQVESGVVGNITLTPDETAGEGQIIVDLPPSALIYLVPPPLKGGF